MNRIFSLSFHSLTDAPIGGWVRMGTFELEWFFGALSVNRELERLAEDKFVIE